MDWNVLEHQAGFYIRLVLNNAHFQHQYFVLDPFAAAVQLATPSYLATSSYQETAVACDSVSLTIFGTVLGWATWTAERTLWPCLHAGDHCLGAAPQTGSGICASAHLRVPILPQGQGWRQCPAV